MGGERGAGEKECSNLWGGEERGGSECVRDVSISVLWAREEKRREGAGIGRCMFV